MILHPIECEQHGNAVRVQCRVEHSGTEEVLWYEVDEKYAPYLTTDRHDGFLVGILLLAMKLGEDIEVRGALSEKLCYNVATYYTRILELIMPSLRSVRIGADRLLGLRDTLRAPGVATGFSAGIDSFCSVYDHLFAEVPSTFRVTHFVFNNVGSHGEWDGERARKLFLRRYDLIKGFPGELGVSFVKIDSNLSEILGMDFERTHTPRNISAVLMLQGLFGRYYYSSAFRYEDCRIGGGKGIGYADPCAVHLLSTEVFDCISTGSQHTRVEKTRRTALVPGSERWLNVCVTPGADGRNCSKCWKCCRTLLTLELLGALEQFAPSFDLTTWWNVRDRYITRTVLRDVDDALSAEIREFAAEIGYSFPARHWLLSYALRIATPPVRAAKKMMGAGKQRG